IRAEGHAKPNTSIGRPLGIRISLLADCSPGALTIQKCSTYTASSGLGVKRSNRRPGRDIEPPTPLPCRLQWRPLPCEKAACLGAPVGLSLSDTAAQTRVVTQRGLTLHAVLMPFGRMLCHSRAVASRWSTKDTWLFAAHTKQQLC